MRHTCFILALCLLSACQATDSVEPAEKTSALKAEVIAPQSPAAPLIPAGGVEDIDFNAYSKALAAPFGLVLGETRLDAIDKIRLHFAPEPGVNMVNLTSSTFELDDGSVMLFARHDKPDDFVFAEEIFAIFSGSGKANKFNQELAAFGLRVKCRRGDNAMEWTTDSCP